MMTRIILPEAEKQVELVTEIEAISAQIMENFDRGIRSPRLMNSLQLSCKDFIELMKNDSTDDS